MNERVVAEIDSQRRKLELDILRENVRNEVNRDILYMCQQDYQTETPCRNLKYETFRKRIIHSQLAERFRQKSRER